MRAAVVARGAAAALAVLVGLLALGWMFFFRVHPVTGSSMEPTLEEGEQVLVLFGRPEFTRFDLGVFLPEGADELRVKRVVGLPGESVALHLGDLWIDGSPLPPDAARPPLLEVFDSTRDDLREWFHFEPEFWSAEEGAWELDATTISPGARAGMMMFELSTERHPEAAGGAEVNDLAVAARLRFGDPPALVRVLLVEQGDTFDLELSAGAESLAVKLTRLSGNNRREVLGEARIPTDPTSWHRFRFENIDNHLSVAIDGERALTASYAENRFHPSDHHHQGRTFGYNLMLGGEGGRVWVTDLRVWRDVYYTPQGSFASREALQLGPAELFVLGDHSAASSDGRHWGPTPQAEVVGRPWAVVWPPDRARRLQGARSTAD
ncbi:MAG TPA: signal peptidase I [Planctomycetota bacterium]|jgi:signal peptidase I|nr:signal peptidase I [Planctomycetota bacterium]